MSIGRNVVIVGGGLAGLSAAIYLARGGRSVTLFERRRSLGGRAVTQLRQGFRFNLGAHAFYRGGAGAAAFRELGVPIVGGLSPRRGTAILEGEEYKLPMGWLSLLTTSLLPLSAKREAAAILLRIRRNTVGETTGLTLSGWLDANTSGERARLVLEALFRLSTYSDRPHEQSAALALAQMRIAMRGTLYLHEGWQRIVDSLHSAAVTVGVNFVTSSRVVSIEHDGAVRAVHLGGLELDADQMDTQSLSLAEATERAEGARLPADTVLLAVDPATAAELAGDVGDSWRTAQPVTAACLDVALRRLPAPSRSFALGVDHPVYLSVHSSVAQLAPKGGALIHMARYMDGARAAGSSSLSPAEVESELESLLDRMQPGWREVLVHRRFLPAMTVSNAIGSPSAPRPSHVTPVRGLFLAGDWVGGEGLLSDAAMSSARAAARSILAGV
ncbi:MAG TPA: FAD-dependent oxidoreductase [Thermoanaerobaculia bacterium]